MKKIYAIICIAIASLIQLQAQAPQGFNYQATVRNSSGDLVVNTNVYFKFNVIQSSETAVPIFTETHYVPTDDLGQVNLVIGQGTANTGVFSELDWSLGSYYLGIELDTGNGFVAMGTTQLLSVPYALYAENSGNATTTPWSVDPTNDNISYDKKVVIGSLTNQNVPPLEVYGTNTGGSSPTANFIRSRYRNNTLLFTTSEEDNNYIGSIGLIEAAENNAWPNSFTIGINDGLQWYNPLRIYYNNQAIRLGFGSDSYTDPNNFGNSSLSLGFNSFATGDFSTTIGVDIEAYSFAETVVGRFNTTYVPIGGIDGYSLEDRMFVVGNGQSESERSDALIISKSGEMSLEGNQIKNLQDPTEAQDAVTMTFLMEKISELQDQIDALQAATGSGTVTDQDGNSYTYLTYGDQVWTVEHAEMVTYRDGTEIPQVTDATEWTNLTTGAWSYYGNDPTKPRLYNWYAVMGIHDAASLTDATLRKEFAPEGWHVPSDAEWTTLENHLIANGNNYDGTTTENKIAKAMASTTGWNSSTTAGAIGNDQSLNNSSGFNAFSQGNRLSDAAFGGLGSNVVFWSSNEFNESNAWFLLLQYNQSYSARSSYPKQGGFSVRFVKGASLNDVNDTDISGTWRLAPEAGALGVGPELNNISWWSNTSDDLTTRACSFDDEYVFNADGSFQNVLGADTWVEDWQGAAAQGCDAPVAPHDGTATATYTYDEAAGTITLNGAGAYLGLAKVINGGELTSPADAPDSITYIAALSEDGNTLELDIEVANGGHWSFKLVKY